MLVVFFLFWFFFIKFLSSLSSSSPLVIIVIPILVFIISLFVETQKNFTFKKPEFTMGRKKIRRKDLKDKSKTENQKDRIADGDLPIWYFEVVLLMQQKEKKPAKNAKTENHGSNEERGKDNKEGRNEGKKEKQKEKKREIEREGEKKRKKGDTENKQKGGAEKRTKKYPFCRGNMFLGLPTKRQAKKQTKQAKTKHKTFLKK